MTEKRNEEIVFENDGTSISTIDENEGCGELTEEDYQELLSIFEESKKQEREDFERLMKEIEIQSLGKAIDEEVWVELNLCTKQN